MDASDTLGLGLRPTATTTKRPACVTETATQPNLAVETLANATPHPLRESLQATIANLLSSRLQVLAPLFEAIPTVTLDDDVPELLAKWIAGVQILWGGLIPTEVRGVHQLACLSYDSHEVPPPPSVGT